jgi:hypothetical protein
VQLFDNNVFPNRGDGCIGRIIRIDTEHKYDRIGRIFIGIRTDTGGATIIRISITAGILGILVFIVPSFLYEPYLRSPPR